MDASDPAGASKDTVATAARNALEASPHPEATAALRAQLPKLAGLPLLGVVQSLGIRRAAADRETQIANNNAALQRQQQADTTRLEELRIQLGQSGAGTSGAAGLRLALETPKARNLPLLTCGSSDDGLPKYKSI